MQLQDDQHIGTEKKMPYGVPSGYFDELPGAVLSAARLDAGKAGAGYQVPAGYFEGLAGQLGKKVRKQQKARYLQLGRISKWAAAASIVLGLGWGIARMQLQPSDVTTALQQVPQSEVQAYLEQQAGDPDLAEMLEDRALPMPEPASSLDRSEVQDYLNETALPKSAELN